MLKRPCSRFLFVVLAAVLAGCDAGPSPTPTAQSPVQPAASPPGSSSGGYSLKGVTLFGVVFETTPTGREPVAGATVYCDACGQLGHTWLETDTNGYYSFSGDLNAGGGIWLGGGSTSVWVGKEGYQDPPGLPALGGPGWRATPINGDTRFDMQLVRP